MLTCKKGACSLLMTTMSRYIGCLPDSTNFFLLSPSGDDSGDKQSQHSRRITDYHIRRIINSIQLSGIDPVHEN